MINADYSRAKLREHINDLFKEAGENLGLHPADLVGSIVETNIVNSDHKRLLLLVGPKDEETKPYGDELKPTHFKYTETGQLKQDAQNTINELMELYKVESDKTQFDCSGLNKDKLDILLHW